MPFIKVYIHFVWSTKNRFPFLETQEIRQKVWKHIKENSIKKGIYIDCINGFSDHCHCLISLSTNQTIEKVMQLIKGESSFWINQQKLTETKFQWQSEYFAVSVSESILDKTRNYIKNQEKHHSRKSFREEYKEFISKYNFEKLND